MTAPQNELDETQPVAEPGMGLGDLSWRGVGRRERDLKLLVVMAKYKSEALGTGTVGTKCRTYSMVNLSAFSSDPAVRKYTNVFRRSVYTSNLPDFVHKIEKVSKFDVESISIRCTISHRYDGSVNLPLILSLLPPPHQSDRGFESVGEEGGSGGGEWGLPPSPY